MTITDWWNRIKSKLYTVVQISTIRTLIEEGGLPENNSILNVFCWFKYNTYLKQRH